MHFRQLEAFRETMRAGSVTKAAKNMNISQPSVSRLISDLEINAGFSLFHRMGRGLSPTPEAHRFYKSVEGMFLGIDRLNELAQTIRSTSGGTVSIGVIPSLSTVEVPDAIHSLCEAQIDVKVQTYVRNTPAIVDAVQLQQLELGLVGRVPPYQGVEILYQTTVPYVCLIPEGHWLDGSGEPLNIDKLSKTESFITFAGIFPESIIGLDQATVVALRKRSRISAANMPMAAALVRATGSLSVVDLLSAGVATSTGGVISRPLIQKLDYH
ncbi:MAG: hypothetical protein CML56_10030, partial [Rhodobacteraceae bacterium]|nr:hypothetical protein [Paracoccaceae bacterium]